MKQFLDCLRAWWRAHIVDEVPDYLADAEFNRARRPRAW